MYRSQNERHAGLRVNVDFARIIFSYPMRLVCYGVVALLATQIVFETIRQYGIEWVAQENGPLEQAQVWLALFASGCLFYSALRMRSGRTVLIVCACLVGYAAARECDTWFETVFFDDAYKYLAGIPLLLIGIRALYLGRHHFIDEAINLARTPAITIFAIAGIYICSICQVLDRPDLWVAVGTGVDGLITKSMVEEFSELFGYLMLAFSGIESVAMAQETCKATVTVPESAPFAMKAA